MKNDLIGVFDSGIGGTSTLEVLREKLPNENFFYFGDTKNNPYGEKTQGDLEKIVWEVSDFLISEKKVKMIVVACNTVTTKCIDFLRKEFPEVVFVGTEPAIKLAFDSGYKNILMMATPGTVESERTAELVATNENPGQKITLLACEGLADAIESKDDSLISKKLDETIEKLKDKSFDAVVLGCTHYVLIRKKIASFFPNSAIIDGNEQITKRVENVLEEQNLKTIKNTPGEVEYFFTEK